MMQWLKAALKQHYFLKCLGYIVLNVRFLLYRVLGRIHTDSGTTHHALSPQESLDYIIDVFEDYKVISNIKSFYGRVAEIGPGDNAGVGLCFLKDGCTQVDLADRFYSNRNMHQQKKIYEVLLQKYPSLHPLLKGADLEKEETFPNLKRYYGASAAAETFFTQENHYDFIVSRSVLEHVNDPLIALEKMMHALKPGGKLIHKVDLRDHGMFNPPFHELKFLETPSFLYTLMTWQAGYPNRILVNQYRDCVRKMGYTPSIWITQLAGVGPIEPHLKFEDIDQSLIQKARQYIRLHKLKFAKAFQHISEEDLMVTGFFLVVTKKD